MLFRFFAEQTTLEETDMISAWLNEDPEKNQKVLDKAYNLYVLGIMCAPNPEAGINNSRSFLRFGWPKVLRYAGVAAGAAIKLLVIYVLAVVLILPSLGLPEKQAAAITVMFSWTQLLTALAGGALGSVICGLISRRSGS